MKNKNKTNIIGRFLCLFLLAGVTIGMLFTYSYSLENSKVLLEKMQVEEDEIAAQQEESCKNEFIQVLYQSNYSLYMDVVWQKNNQELNPANIYMPSIVSDLEVSINEENQNEYNNDDYEENQYNFYDREEIFFNFNNLMNRWHETFYQQYIDEYQLEYYVIDNTTGNIKTNTLKPLSSLIEENEIPNELKSNYSFYVVFEYDENGILEIPYFYGLDENKRERYQTIELTKELIQNELGNNGWYQYNNQIKGPSNLTIIFASAPELFYYGNSRQYDNYWSGIISFQNGGFFYAFVISLIIITLLAFLLPLKKSWGIGKGLSAKIPLEVSLAGLFAIIMMYEGLLSLAADTARGDFIAFMGYTFSEEMLRILNYVFNFVIWILVYFVWFMAVLSIRQVFSIGLKQCFLEKTLIGRFGQRVKKILDNRIKTFIRSLKEIDLRDPSNKIIIKVLLVNFIILSILCSIWVAGIFVLILYSVILFFILRKYMEQVKNQYIVLVDATSKMAEGNLEITINKDLGLFEPLKEELTKVQYGFKKAVEEEMKSQKMKTELITNVSHDLKTPLTAIITYVNLLKEDNITKEDRKSYIDTLDKKSLRLKALIEDLFEMSKASSNNVIINLVEVDLVSLIKQVQLELGDKIKESEIEFRNHLPQDKVVLMLDSEKTYRIFENLIINIVKYSMPHSRAYVELEVTETAVITTLKNTSATELDFDSTDITERFVRGDKARNTEGSGLGLAIVKSFVELQGGKFKILLDGDLFKARIEWKR